MRTNIEAHSMKKISIQHTVLGILVLSVVFSLVLISCNVESLTSENASSSNLSLELSADINNQAPPAQSKDMILRLSSTQNLDILIAKLGAKLIQQLSIGDAHFVKIRGSNLGLKALGAYKEIIDVEYEQYRRIYVAPNDTYYTSQYAPQITELESVWDTYTGSGIKVAVIDTGIDTTHDDFEGPDSFEEGYDFNNNTSYTTSENIDVNGHGTHVAGIIAARKNNNEGIAGVAPDAILIPYKASDNGGSFWSLGVAAAIKKAADAGAEVINMSLGGLSATGVEAQAVQYALEKGASIVVATGNDDIEFLNYPASYPGVIAVGSSNGRDEVSIYSTSNMHISVVAPGEEILSLKTSYSTGVKNEYVVFNGTSMATPFVSGVVALLKQKFTSASPAQIKKLIENTALDIGETGFDVRSGYGRIQPKQALAVEESNLPTVTLQKVEFTITETSTGEASAGKQNYKVIILDDTDTYMYSLYTNSQGKTSVGLPKGTYKYASSYLGVPYSGDLVVDNSALSFSKNFVSNDFSGYYRILTYKNSVTNDNLDTNMYIKKIDGTNTALIATNDDGEYGGFYSEIIFVPELGAKYAIYIEAASDTPYGWDEGDYILAVDDDILKTRVSSGTGEVYDFENSPDLDKTKTYKGTINSSNTQDIYFVSF